MNINVLYRCACKVCALLELSGTNGVKVVKGDKTSFFFSLLCLTALYPTSGSQLSYLEASASRMVIRLQRNSLNNVGNDLPTTFWIVSNENDLSAHSLSTLPDNNSYILTGCYKPLRSMLRISKMPIDKRSNTGNQESQFLVAATFENSTRNCLPD